MPVLTFEQLPPDGNWPIRLSSTAAETTPLRDVKHASAVVKDAEATLTNAYPVVRLDVDTISEAAASRLAASLLGHVLFLKNQIPFPVMQLGRIPGGKTNSRAAKLRTELMASYDTISSHLDTTFSALTTALARCSVSEAQSHDQAHVAILVGPSLGTAKTKVIMGIDGLERKVWAVRSVAPRSESAHENSDEDDAEEDDEGEAEAEAVDAGNDEECEELPEDSEDEEDEAEEGVNDEPEEEEGDSVDNGEEEEDGSSEADDDSDADADSAPPPPYISYAEEQKFLQSADRLLSRVLAAADAEGNGIASEMSPTQTHVLIRAPRVFKHPAWVPRQNVSGSLDTTLADFLAASGVRCPPDLPAPAEAKKGSAKRSRVEGVWVTTRGGVRALAASEIKGETDHEQAQDSARREGPRVTDEDAEMIWWSWDGKFVGFSDW